MKEERLSKLREIAPSSGVIGVADGRREDKIRYAMGSVKKGSDEAQKLENEGYILVYPNLPEHKQTDEVAKYVSENSVMILDKFTESPGYDVLKGINDFYDRYDIDKSLVLAENQTTRRFKACDEVKKIYDKIGAKYEVVGDDVRVTDESLYPVKKGKIAQIYENAKGKVKGAFNNLKNFFRGKEAEKDIGQDR